MQDFFKILSNINVFDIIFLVIMIYFIIQCFLKGFSLSFISFMKWVFALVVTIILVPKLQPWVNDYIESELIAYLSARSIYKLPITFPSTTGVLRPLSGGKLYNYL